VTDASISLQVVYGSVGVAVRLEGTPYSPDVFDDLIRRCVNGVSDVLDRSGSDIPLGEPGDGYETFVKFMESRMKDDD
jgi:hypothetical protein